MKTQLAQDRFHIVEIADLDLGFKTAAAVLAQQTLAILVSQARARIHAQTQRGVVGGELARCVVVADVAFQHARRAERPARRLDLARDRVQIRHIQLQFGLDIIFRHIDALSITDTCTNRLRYSRLARSLRRSSG